MVRFSIFGIPVEVQPFFWITLVLIGGALGADSASAILQTLLFVLAGFISILVHELGHALTARKFGAYSSIVLQAFGGIAQHSGVRLSRPQSFAVTAAGPLLQIALGLAVWYSLPHLTGLKPHASYFFFTLMSISFIWAAAQPAPHPTARWRPNAACHSRTKEGKNHALDHDRLRGADRSLRFHSHRKCDPAHLHGPLRLASMASAQAKALRWRRVIGYSLIVIWVQENAVSSSWMFDVRPCSSPRITNNF
jgi:hypothetical protein